MPRRNADSGLPPVRDSLQSSSQIRARVIALRRSSLCAPSVNDTIAQTMKRFAEQYLGHVNAYTGLAYKDDPAIAAVLITNENDLTGHYGNALLPDKTPTQHIKRYMELAEAFAKQHGLAKQQTWRAWEHGPSKLFLNDLEQRFDQQMIDHLRTLGVKVPIVTTSAAVLRNGTMRFTGPRCGSWSTARSVIGVVPSNAVALDAFMTAALFTLMKAPPRMCHELPERA